MRRVIIKTPFPIGEKGEMRRAYKGVCRAYLANGLSKWIFSRATILYHDIPVPSGSHYEDHG